MGCTGTHFTNTSGLHSEDHYSTARDMATIMAYAMNNPFIKKAMASNRYTTVAPLTSDIKVLSSTWYGQMGSYKSTKATMFAAKTGYTPEAGNCLASLSKTTSGKEYIIISAGAYRNDQISGKNQAFSDAADLCDTYIK